MLRLDPRSGVPTYLQIVHQVEHSLRLGYLRFGDQLPRVKDAVATLSVHPNTVLKAYRELELKGLVSGRPGQGTFVVADYEPITKAELTRLKRKLITGWLAEAAAAGLDDTSTSALFAAALAEFSGSGSKTKPSMSGVKRLNDGIVA